MLAHLKWVDIGINMPNTAISEVISGFVEVTDGDIQTSLVLWKFCSFLCQCFYMECNENWTIRGGFDSRRNPARCSTRLREISFYLCSRCKIKGMLHFQKKIIIFRENMLKASLLICLPLLGFSQREFKAKFDDCGEKILSSSSYYSLFVWWWWQCWSLYIMTMRG